MKGADDNMRARPVEGSGIRGRGSGPASFAQGAVIPAQAGIQEGRGDGNRPQVEDVASPQTPEEFKNEIH